PVDSLTLPVRSQSEQGRHSPMPALRGRAQTGSRSPQAPRRGRSQVKELEAVEHARTSVMPPPRGEHSESESQYRPEAPAVILHGRSERLSTSSAKSTGAIRAVPRTQEQSRVISFQIINPRTR